MPEKIPTADELNAQGRAVAETYGEDWSHDLHGHVIHLVGPGWSRHPYHYESPFWRRTVDLAREMRDLRTGATNGTMPGPRW